MPIKPLILQRRLTEVGRIRIGQLVPTKSGKMRPDKLDRLRFTSSDRSLLDQIAGLYGGEVRAWTPQGGGAAAWEIITPADNVPVIVPPQSLTQWMETWSGGGAQRRCDGETEFISGDPCICTARDQMDCKPTTRLSIMLRDVQSIGVWRLESKGWTAASELPGMAELLERVGGYVQARLYLKAVRQVTGGETRDFIVPALAVDGVTPAQLLAGTSNGYQTPELARATPAQIEAAGSCDTFVDATLNATSSEEVRRIFRAASESGCLDTPVTVEGVTKDLRTVLTIVGKGLAEQEERIAVAERNRIKPVQDTELPVGNMPADIPEVDQDTTAIWTQAMISAPGNWGMEELTKDFAELHGGQQPADVSAEVLTAYVANLKSRGANAAEGVPF